LNVVFFEINCKERFRSDTRPVMRTNAQTISVSKGKLLASDSFPVTAYWTDRTACLVGSTGVFKRFKAAAINSSLKNIESYLLPMYLLTQFWLEEKWSNATTCTSPSWTQLEKSRNG
jgi:hypothetical protein